MAKALPALVDGHGDNRGEFRDAVKASVEEGHGAVFGASVARALDTGELKDDVAGATGDGIHAVADRFNDADQGATQREAELGVVARQWQGVMSPEQMKAGVDAFHADHGEFAKRDAAAATLTKTLAGAGLAADSGGDLGEKSRAALEGVPALARTDVGARAIGDALVREGRGEATFMRPAGDVAQRDDASKGAFADGVQRSILSTQGDALARGDTRGLVDALRGASRVMPDAGSRGDFDRFATDVANQPPGQSADKLAIAIASSAKSIAGGVSDQKTAALDDVESVTSSTSFKVFGASLGAIALGQSLVGFRDGVSAREAVGAVANAAGLGTSVAALVLKEGAPAFATKGLPVVGYALSAFDTVQALKRGDEIGALAAAAPLAGAAAGAAIGAASGSIAPGVGTAIGGAVGALVGLGIGVGRQLLSDSPDEKLEQSTQSFLRGALERGGLSHDDADRASFRLRDINGDFFGAGTSLQAIAQKTGESPQQVLGKIARLDDERLHDFVKQSLSIKDNGDAVRDAEKEVSDGDRKAADIPAFALDDAGLAELVARYRSL